MSDQHTLFEEPPPVEPGPLKKNYRRDSPRSSERAINEHSASGRLHTNRRRAHNQVIARPGLTSKQLAGDDFRWLMELRKRLSDLERDGLIRSTQEGPNEKRWFPIDA